MQRLKKLFSAPDLAEHPRVWRTLRQLPRPVWFLFLGTFINKFGTFVVPFLALHLTRLGFTASQASLTLGAYGVGHFLASAVGGHLADSLGRRKTIVWAMLGGAVCMILLSQARSLPILVVMAFLTGLAGESYRPASSALLADLIPEKHRVTAYAGYRFAINAGFAFGPAVAGFLAHYSYFWLFLGDAVTSALYGLIALVFLPREPKRPNPGWSFVSDATRSLAEAVRVAASDRRFMRLVLASFGTGWVFLQMVSTLGLQVKAAGYSDQIFGFVLALNGALIVLFEIPMCSITQRLPARPVIAAGFALIACGAGLYAWVHTAWGFALGMAILTFGEMISMPVSLAYAANLAPETMRGRYMGVYGLTWAAALTCGPSLGVLLFGWQPAALWLSCLGVGLLSTAIIAAGGKDRSPQNEAILTLNPPLARTAGDSDMD